MKKIITLAAIVSVLLAFTACTANNTDDGKAKSGAMPSAGSAVNDVLDGAENVVDDMTGSNNNGSNTNDDNNKTHENNPDNTVENQTNTNN